MKPRARKAHVAEFWAVIICQSRTQVEHIPTNGFHRSKLAAQFHSQNLRDIAKTRVVRVEIREIPRAKRKGRK